MDLKEYIRLELDNSQKGISRVLDGLSQSEISWRPCSGCNSIGLILYHVARFEDLMVQMRIQNKPQIWESAKWFQKMGLPVEDGGAHYTVDQVNAFPVPALTDIIDYFKAVRTSTLDFVNEASSEDLSRQITTRMGMMPAAGILEWTIGHTFQHTGEISYLRGMQRGLDK